MVTDTELYSQLISDCIRKDARAQKALYTLFAPAMFKICLRYATDKSSAQDIFQDAFDFPFVSTIYVLEKNLIPYHLIKQLCKFLDHLYI